MTEVMTDRKRDEEAIIGMLARVKERVSTMVFSDVMTLVRLAYVYGYDDAKLERMHDIELFRGD